MKLYLIKYSLFIDIGDNIVNHGKGIQSIRKTRHDSNLNKQKLSFSIQTTSHVAHK